MKIAITRILGALTVSSVLASCGGGSPDEELLTGVFSDSPVAGLSYATASVTGVTDADGVFSYREGETVVFRIGNLALPVVVGAEHITPLDLASSDDISDPVVVNIARLLQSLDSDSDPENGISIPGQAAAVFTEVSVFDASDDQSVDIAVEQVFGNDRQSVNTEQAIAHFAGTLSATAGSSGTLDQLHYIVPEANNFAGESLYFDEQGFTLSSNSEVQAGSVSVQHGVYQLQSESALWFVSVSDTVEGLLACFNKSPVAVSECTGDLYHLFKDEQLAIDFGVVQAGANTEDLTTGAANEDIVEAEVDAEAGIDDEAAVDGSVVSEVEGDEATAEVTTYVSESDENDSAGSEGGDNNVVVEVTPAQESEVLPEPVSETNSEPEIATDSVPEAAEETVPVVVPVPVSDITIEPEVITEPVLDVIEEPSPEVIPVPVVGVVPELEVVTDPVPEVIKEPSPEVISVPVVEVVAEPEVVTDPVPEVIEEPSPEVIPVPVVVAPEPEVIIEPVPEAIEEPTPEVIPDSLLDITPKQEPEVVIDAAPEVPEVMQEFAPEVVPGPLPEVTPEQEPEVVTDQVPEVMEEPVPEVVPDPLPEVTPEQEPEVVIDLVPEVMEEPAPEVDPDRLPVVAPEQEPEVVPDPVMEVMEELVPEIVQDPLPEITPEPQEIENPVTAVTPDAELVGVQLSDITDIIVLTGQANAAAIQTDFDPAIDTGNEGMFAFNEDGQWRVAELNQNWDGNLPSNFSADVSGREPYNNLAFHVGKSLVEQSDRVVGIIMITAVGEGISHWDYNSLFYREMRNKVNAALAQLPHKTGVDAMIWMQGEADWFAEGSADQGATGFISTDSDFYRNYYLNKLNQLILNLRSEKWYGPGAQFICGETKRAELNPHLMALNGNGDDRTSCASASDLPTHTIDPFENHFSADGLRTLGGRIADLYNSADR